MNRKEALDLISEVSYFLSEEISNGLPDGKHSEIGFDEKLLMDLASACQSWLDRRDDRKLIDPYCVWFYDGSNWIKQTEDQYQEDAYREWFFLTACGKKNHNATFEQYYYLGSAKNPPIGRHSVEKEDDDFSIRYLLNKTFGD